MKYVAVFSLAVLLAIITIILFVVVPAHSENPKKVWAANARAMLKVAIWSDQINHFNNGYKLIEELPSYDKIKGDLNYNYIVYISKENSGISKKSQIAEGSEKIGKHFVAYAWPKRWGDNGDILIAITEDGTLYETEPSRAFPGELFVDGIPIWNGLQNNWGSGVSERWHQYKAR